MKLTIFERLSIQDVLPQQENFVTLRILRELQEVLSPSEKEVKKYDLKVIPTSPKTSQITWNHEKYDLRKIETEVEIGETAHNIIAEILKKKNEAKELTMGLFSIYEKFVEGQKGNK